MTAVEVMNNLYPTLPQYQRDANARWLEDAAAQVRDGGYIGSPRDHWIVRKVSAGNYEIEYAPGRGH